MTEPVSPAAHDGIVSREASASSLLPADDKGVARGVVVSATSQVGSMVVHMALNIVSSLVIIRYLAPPNYGDYVLVLTLMTMIGLLSDFGLNKLGIREVAVDGTGEAEVVGTVIALRLGLAMVAAVVIQLVLFALGRSAEVHTAAAIASITFAANALLSVTIAFNVRLQQHVEAFTILFGELVETSLILWVVLAGGTLTELFAATAFGTALAALIAIFLAHRRLSLRARFTPRTRRTPAARRAPAGRGQHDRHRAREARQLHAGDPALEA